MEVVKHMFQEYVIIDNKIWFSSSTMNGLFCADLEGGMAKLIGIFPGEKLFQFRLYTDIYAYGNSLVFIPHKGNNICIYNICGKNFVQIDSPISKKERQRHPYFTVQYEEKVFLFHDYMQGFAVLNIRDHSLQKYSIPNNIRQRISRFWWIKCIVGNIAYMVIDNLLVTIQLNRNAIKLQEIGKKSKEFVCIEYDGELFWIVDSLGWLYSYKIGEKEAKSELLLVQEEWDGMIPRIKGIGESNKIMWFFFNKMNYIIRLDLCTMKKETIPMMRSDAETRYIEYSYLDVENNQIRISMEGLDKHWILETDTMKWRETYYETPWEEMVNSYRTRLIKESNLLVETSLGRGLDIIRYCLTMQKGNEALGANKNYGKEIYQHLQ